MRKPMMAGNWKMNKSIPDAIALSRSICDRVCDFDAVECVICPPFVALPTVRGILADAPLLLGAQNLHWEESGAFTGEVSAAMLEGLVEYAIVGHSERRQYFEESDEQVNRKLKIALAHGITPILCVGESLEQNEAGQTGDFVSGQVRAALAGIPAEQARQIVIAYEPIWAIGTGRAASAEEAGHICGNVVRAAVADLYGEETASQTRVLYGGSTKPANIAEIMQQEPIDGALIGGASLQADSYSEMVEITQKLYTS